MSSELNLQVSLNFTKNGATIQRQLNAAFNVAGTAALQAIQNIGTSDETLALGDVATLGFLLLHNLGAFVLVTTPAAPTVTPVGTTGAATWTYKIVAKQADGSYSEASAGGSTSTGNATLTSGNKNTLTWLAIPGAASYDIYRTAHWTSPSTNGLIGNTSNLTFDDTGLAGDSSTAPSTAIDNVILIGANGSSYPNELKGTEFSIVRFNGTAIHAKANTSACDLEYILIPD